MSITFFVQGIGAELHKVCPVCPIAGKKFTCDAIIFCRLKGDRVEERQEGLPIEQKRVELGLSVFHPEFSLDL
jgi:hypothetical protein